MKKNRLDIIYEDKYLIVINKPGGLLTINKDNADEMNLYSLVFDYLRKKNHKVFIIHRLDKDTSGLIMFAKNDKIKKYFQDNWDNVNREYISIVHGKTKSEGEIKSYIKENKFHMSYSTFDKSGKYAVTKYKTIKSNNEYSLVNIKLITGRKNQIRLHMSENNTPIVGDKKYGIKDNYNSMFLMANKLSFIHPITKKQMHFVLDVPFKYERLFKVK